MYKKDAVNFIFNSNSIKIIQKARGWFTAGPHKKSIVESTH